MGFQSQAGHVGVKTQAARGTYADPGAASPDNGIFFKVRQGGLGIARTLMIPDPEIGGNRDVSTAELGEVTYTGDYQFYGRMGMLATLLAAAAGKSTDTFAASVGTHVIGSNDQSSLPWLSIEEQVGNGFETFRYTDSKVDELKLSVATGGYFEGTVTVAAITQLAGATPTPVVNQVWDNTPVAVATNVFVTFNGVTLPAKSWDLDLKNNLETNDSRLGQFVVGDITEKRRELTMAVKTRPISSAQWRQAAYGSASATGPQGSPTSGPVTVTITTWEKIGGTVTPYSLSINVPVGTIKPFKVTPSGDNVIETDFDIQAFRPDNTVDLATYTVVNGLATVA